MIQKYSLDISDKTKTGGVVSFLLFGILVLFLSWFFCFVSIFPFSY